MQGTGFDCLLCTKLAIDGRTCGGCGLVYCNRCLNELFGQDHQCIQCQSKRFTLLTESALSDIYHETLIKSQVFIPPKDQQQQIQQTPTNVIPIQQQCFLNEQCKNFEYCKQNAHKHFKVEKVCSVECLVFLQINGLVDQQNFKAIRQQLIQLENSIKEKFKIQVDPLQVSQLGLTYFQFNKFGQGIVEKQGQIILQEEEYTFKTVMSTIGFMGGKHYWKVIPLQVTKNEMKIGVATSNVFDLKTAFSDYNFGFAYYTVGQFRNGSNSNGYEYGAKFKNSGEVGVFLDMDRGVLAFSYNGQFLGKAVTSSLLKAGPVYPCVALLHSAGFEYKCGIPIPPNLLAEFLK